MQAFKLERPTWIKYLQLHVLSHHGTEAVCALNDVCVFGKSAAEDLEARLNLEPPAEDPTTAVAEPLIEMPALPEAPKPASDNSSSNDSAELSLTPIEGAPKAQPGKGAPQAVTGNESTKVAPHPLANSAVYIRCQQSKYWFD